MENEKIDYILYSMNGKYKIEATENGKRVGTSYFVLKDRGSGSTSGVWIYNISVEPQKRRKGIGSNMLSIIEYECKIHGKYAVEGKFYPEENMSAEGLEKFYLKHGYSINYESYQKLIFKRIQYVNEQIIPAVEYDRFEVDSLDNPKRDIENVKVVETVRRR